VSISPRNAEEVSEAVRAHHGCVLPRAGGTKPALSRVPEGTTSLDLRGLSGMVEYDPAEYTFTALAGTPLAVVQAELAGNGQYLPFDPPLGEQGATLGGTVAGGLSGPGRLRYGGVRDFIVGVQWVDGSGTLIRGGGRVVKNAAGFDFPKLFTGSLGRLGVLTEMTFKVFPAPVARVTCVIECRDLADAVDRLCFLCGQPWEVEALELNAAAAAPRLLVRFMGDEPALTARVQVILTTVQRSGRILPPEEATAAWQRLDALEIGEPDAPLVRVPLTPLRIAGLENALARTPSVRHYSMAGNLAWIAGVEPAALDPLLREQSLQGLTLRGGGPLRPGVNTSSVMENKVKAAMDAEGKFPGW
jgi:glycolate oxidase FAD binding subunit